MLLQKKNLKKGGSCSAWDARFAQRLVLPLITLPAGDLRARAQPQPGREVLVGRGSAHVGADLADDHQRSRHVDAVDACEVHAAHLVQVGAQVELRCLSPVACRPSTARKGQVTRSAQLSAANTAYSVLRK